MFFTNFQPHGMLSRACLWRGSQMARNLLTLFGIDLMYNVSPNQTVCPLLRLVLHSAVVGGECTRASL